jgi:2-amino-4-hydroxy-6-hydroxymethyldihydropteridine diphosphokinase
MFFFCLIGLGSNLGNRELLLNQAVECLRVHPRMRVAGKSSWRETSPIGGPSQQSPYLNGAALLETSLSPEEMLVALQEIETRLGRTRRQRWDARTIDLDILLYDQRVLDTPTLVVPHPRMAWRRFVLEPAAEIAGSMLHPTTGWTVSRLLENLDTASPYVAITGSIGVGKTQLATRLAEESGANLIVEQLDQPRLEAFYAEPSGQAWDMELEFLQQRTALLSSDSDCWLEPGRIVLSDFWYDQSPAFASVWLPREKQEAFRDLWQRSRSRVVRPKLIVLLECEADELHRRVARRGRPFERGLSKEQLQRIALAIAQQATSPDEGPLLRLNNDDTEVAFAEALAAMEAMR